MDPITAALLAGAAATANNAIIKPVARDAYEALRCKVKLWFTQHQRPDGVMALAMIEEELDTWRGPLMDALQESGAPENQDLVREALALLAAMRELQQVTGDVTGKR